MTELEGGRERIRAQTVETLSPLFFLTVLRPLPPREKCIYLTSGPTRRSAPARRTRGPGAHGAPRSASARARSGAGPAVAVAKTSQPEFSFSGVPGTHPVSMFGHLRHGGWAGASRNGSGPGSRKP